MGAETATQAAKEQAKKAEKKPVQAATKPATATQADTKQKIKKQAATGKQKTAAAPAKEGAPVKRCTVSFTGACVVLVSAAVFFATTMALRSNSSMSTGAAEVVTTKSVSNDHGTAVSPQFLPSLLALSLIHISEPTRLV